MKVYWPIKLNPRAILILCLITVSLLGLPIFFLKPGAVQPDVSAYLAIAQKVALGQGIDISPESYYSSIFSLRSPAYPFLFLISFKLFGISLSSALLITKLAAWGSYIVLFLLIRKLFNTWTGLASVALAATSTYMVTFPASLNNDQTMAFFMLLGLWLMVEAIERGSYKLALLAGIVSGFGFLIKELAIIWAPLPLYLILGVPRWRKGNRFLCFLIYASGYVIPLGIWWLSYYLFTGNIFLVNRIPESLLTLLWLLVFVLISGFLIYRLVLRRQSLEKWHFLYQKVASPAKRFSGLWVWVVWTIVTYIFTVGLANRTVFRFESLTEIPLRISGFIAFFERRILPEHPLFQFSYLGIAFLILAINAIYIKRINKGTYALLLMILACVPQILTAQITGAYEMSYRYLMHLYWTGYALLASALVLVIEHVSRLVNFTYHQFFESKHNVSPVFNGFIVLSLLVIGFQSCWDTAKDYEFTYPSPSNYNVQNVQLVSQWIKKNIPAGSNLASAENYLPMIDFYTGDEYNIYRWGVESSDKGFNSAIWPYQQIVVYEENEGELKLVGRAGDSVEIERPMYLQYHLTRVYPGDSEGPGGAVDKFFTVDRYATISEDSLIAYLKEFEIDYLILPEANHHRTLHVIPDYFYDHPAFHEVFSTGWSEGNYSFGIRIFSVDRSRLELTDYPVILNAQEWLKFISHAKTLLVDEYDLNKVIKSLGGGPIVFRPASAANFGFYIQLAETYEAGGEIDLAGFEYHLALQEAPQRANELSVIAEQLTSKYPDAAGSWLLLGDVHYFQGDLNQAEEAYQQAVNAPGSNHHTYGAAYQMLGKMYLANGKYSEANTFLSAALEKSAFGGNSVQKDMSLAQANIHLAQGNLEQALTLFTRYFKGDSASQFVSTSSTDRVIYMDLLKQYAGFQEMDPNIHPAVFFVGEKVRPTLYAHPNSTIEFPVEVPANSQLSFTPLVDPAVWQYGKGDGVQFTVFLLTDEGKRFTLFDAYLDPKNIVSQRSAITYIVDLSRWAGETVTIILSTGCGPNDDCSYDWAGWGEPRITQPVYYDFLEDFASALPSASNGENGHVDVLEQTINYDTRRILYQHPTSRVTFSVFLPERAVLQFGLGMAPEVWTAENSDGAVYNIYVRDPEEPFVTQRVYHRIIDPQNNLDDRRWFDERVDLSAFGGKEVEIIFEALPGPADNYDFDWGGWSSPVIIDETGPGSRAAYATESATITP